MCGRDQGFTNTWNLIDRVADDRQPLCRRIYDFEDRLLGLPNPCFSRGWTALLNLIQGKLTQVNVQDTLRQPGTKQRDERRSTPELSRSNVESRGRTTLADITGRTCRDCRSLTTHRSKRHPLPQIPRRPNRLENQTLQMEIDPSLELLASDPASNQRER